MPPAFFIIRARWSRFQVRKVVLRFVKSFSDPGAGVEVARPRARLAEPPGVGLWRITNPRCCSE